VRTAQCWAHTKNIVHLVDTIKYEDISNK
jgi:hypothetical protein